MRALESSATAEARRRWNRHQTEQVCRGNCQLNQDPTPPAHLPPELRPELLPAPKKGKPVIEAAARATGRGGPQRQNRTIVLLLTRPQAEQLGEDGSGAPFLPIPRLVPPITFRKRLRGALPRSRARGRRAQTRQHPPQAPAEQPRSHAQAPAEDDPQRSHTGSGAHAPAASCPRARRAGQPSIASRKKALSGRVTPLLSKSGCISSPGIPLMLVNLKVAIS